ncbi:MAG: DUF4346 domain-containing protein [Candidatus Altiarchaeota archaeon]
MTVKSVPFKPDPKGFFYIYVDVERKEIVVEHYKNVERKLGLKKVIVSGKVNRKFRGKKAEKIYREIIAHNLVSLMDHAAYLGAELAKAELALTKGVEYEQDEKLTI